MILLLTNERDLTTDYIVLELQRRALPYFRLNSERLSEAYVRFTPTRDGAHWMIDFTGARFSIADVFAGYFRRPGSPEVPTSVTNSADRVYCEQEWTSLLRSLYAAVGNRWLNSPMKIAVAEDKPRQLAVALSLGMSVPETLVTNDPVEASAFICGGDTIGKPLYSGLLQGNGQEAERVIFTTRIDAGLNIDPSSLGAAPIILQRQIHKRFDIRATVVQDKVFAAAIESQGGTETIVDWRRGPQVDLPHHICELPEDIARQCVELTAKLGLRFAAIDLVLDCDGRYWFLEANPNGQWAWVETRTGLPIASAIVDALVDIGHKVHGP